MALCTAMFHVKHRCPVSVKRGGRYVWIIDILTVARSESMWRSIRKLPHRWMHYMFHVKHRPAMTRGAEEGSRWRGRPISASCRDASDEQYWTLRCPPQHPMFHVKHRLVSLRAQDVPMEPHPLTAADADIFKRRSTVSRCQSAHEQQCYCLHCCSEPCFT